MTINEIINLVIDSTDVNPYSGKLSAKDNLIAAIDLAKLYKDFADKGQNDEAMNIPSSKWVIIIDILNDKLKRLNGTIL